ncbi:UvrD-helicase domain-containing protein [Limnobacter humi]|uniref:DNA 3'-5' helicase n=1 Tax=Limnobacter humi TaxID=1778671 RepID=A0ABT1WBQ9_9BURK|nr:UvrD-helicase domain-containing protein [Limnobacter humi]MCQ8894945.1 UvrD-helicase domain-containing protein [Limnobacter humi]
MNQPTLAAADWTAIACDPQRSVVVEACAGSGKTWLLTARLFRLLLAGAKPDEILAITFTRKAAEEMRQRLFGLLQECALADDERLAVLLSERGAVASAGNLLKARDLAGLVLTNSRGVTMNTFHGWFTSLCQLAPLSSGFSRQSEPTEQTAFWMDQAIDSLTRKAVLACEAGKAVLDALNVLAVHLNRDGQRQVLVQAMSNRVACEMVFGNAQARISERDWEALFDLNSREHWPSQCLLDAAFARDCADLARLLGMGTEANQRKATELQGLVEQIQHLPGDVDGRQALFAEVQGFFLTQKQEPNKTLIKTNKALTTAPGFDQAQFVSLVETLQGQCMEALARERDQIDLQCTQALAVLVKPLFDEYSQLKSAQGLCDFDDLEATALQLTMDPQQSAYMLQKLDTRVKHLLVDEFQDTNPVQWNVLRHWLGEYGAGERPTVFLVGDPKQSIYRFRRAEARLFEQATAWLQTHFDAVCLYSDDTRRCSATMVELVNAVYAGDGKRGRTPFRPHRSLSTDTPKPAQVWPALSVYPLVEKEAERSEGELCACTLQAWLQQGRIAGLHQVLVLVQAHGSAAGLIAALREANLPYTVKDQGERYGSLVWADTVALLRVLNNPDDNMALLQLLRSPLLGAQSDQLQRLMEQAAGQGHTTVWQTLANLKTVGQQPFENWVTQIEQWLAWSRSLPLFETLGLIVDDTDAARRYLAVAQPRERALFAGHWDWLKAWALGVNKGRFPSLTDALAEAERLQVYGGSDGDGGEPQPGVLRIMTVHAAKGLEADHVWLLDANRNVGGMGSAAGLLMDWPLGERMCRSVTVMANTRKPSRGRAEAFAQDEAAYRDEEDHLLYVALTRARFSVHVSGRAGSKSAAGAWYERLLAQVQGELAAWPDGQRQPLVPPALDVRQAVQTDLFSPAEPVVWSRTACPAVPLLRQPVGEAIVRIDSPELRMGTAWHKAMEQVDTARGVRFEDWWQARWLDCEAEFLRLGDDELAAVRAACETVLNCDVLRPFLADAVQAWNELEWTLPNGRFLRADRVVLSLEGPVVLDYKWAVNAHNLADYTAQVLEYVGLVDQTLNVGQTAGRTRAALIDRVGQIHWLTSV